ncbi:MAG: Gfo/Idh/MocA family oxidoreductase [Burkholderiales bacterium]|nr:Gfo/Idh/MocA family oxidoreductase [Burkholderiales bacterium]GIK85893.1 MAG: oxidoreductase [Betaproteobacteria bacterium]
MRTVRWGVIGCGEVVRTKSGPAFVRAANSRLVAVADRHPERAEAFAREHGVERAHGDVEAVLRADDVDVVYVATMTESHRDLVLRCAAAGKSVLVEKPMGMSHAECVAMDEACRAAGVRLWVAYYRRALPRFTKVRDLVADGAIGEVRMVVMRHLQRIPSPEAMRGPFWGWRLDAKRSGGGIFFEAVGHTLDILDFIVGPVDEARGLAVNQAGAYAPEDAVAASFRYASGALGSGAWCFAADCDDEGNEIIGSRGRIAFATFPPLDPPAGRPPVPIRLIRGGAVETFPIADPPYVHQPLVQSIVDELNGVGACPSTPASAMRTARVVDAVLAGFRAGRAPA